MYFVKLISFFLHFLAGGNGIGNIDPIRSQVPFANGPYDRYENGYSRGMNGPSPPGGGPPSYHDQPAYDRYSCDRYFTEINNFTMGFMKEALF